MLSLLILKLLALFTQLLESKNVLVPVTFKRAKEVWGNFGGSLENL